MGFRIIRNKVPTADEAQRALATEKALRDEAKLWAEKKVGDPTTMAALFLAKVQNVRRLDVLSKGEREKSLDDVGENIRKQASTELHGERIFDLERLLKLL